MNFSKIKNKALVATATFILLFTSSCVTVRTNTVVSSNNGGIVIRDVKTGKIHNLSGDTANGDFGYGEDYHYFIPGDTVWVYPENGKDYDNKQDVTTEDCSVDYEHEKIHARKCEKAKQNTIYYFDALRQQQQQR